MALYSNTETYDGPRPAILAQYHGPTDTYQGAETRRRRKRRSAMAIQSFRSRRREKDPYQTNKGDPWGLKARMSGR